jgi:glycosyltransferase involved in cell wall biosynthesis
MNVLVLAGSVAHTEAGAAHAALDLANTWAKDRSLQVHLCTHGLDSGSVHPSIEVLRYPPPRSVRALWRVHNLYGVMQAKRALGRHDFSHMDLCYTPSIELALAFRDLYPRVPIVSHWGAVLTKREFLEETHGAASWFTRLDALLAERLEKQSYKGSRWCHLASTKLVARFREEYFDLPKGFFHICPYGISPEKFDRDRTYGPVRQAHGVPESAVVLLTVSRLVKWKNTEMTLRAFARCASRSAYLIVVGDGEERERLTVLAASLGVADRTRFVGHQADPAPFYSASDIFVLPSLIESFGVVYAEAMFMGLPCIGMRYDPPQVLSSASDVIVDGETGYCVSTLEELTGRFDLLIQNEDLRRKMGRNARQVACSRYSCDQYGEDILSLARRQFGIETPSEATYSRRAPLALGG